MERNRQKWFTQCKQVKSFSYVSATLSLYLPVAISGFIVFGDRMNQSNILDEMEGGPILYTVIALITSHLMMAYLIVMNPINQDLERFLGIEASKFLPINFNEKFFFGVGSLLNLAKA